MAVYDRWHLSHPDTENPDPEKRPTPCKCGRGRNKLYPTGVHLQGKRWQVRWRTPDGKQPKRNFAERYGDNPDKHAEAFNAQVNAELDADTYTDPELGRTLLAVYVQNWRSSLTGDSLTLENYDRRIAHIVGTEDAPSVIAEVEMSTLAKRPSLIQKWVKSLEDADLGARYIKDIFSTLSSIFIAAVEDGVARKNPTKAKSIRLPRVVKKVIEPWEPSMVGAARESLMDKGCGEMADLGAAAGLRQGEIFGLAVEDIVFLAQRKRRKIKIRRQVKIIKDRKTGKLVVVFAPPKGGKERDVPLAPGLERRLAARMKDHPPVKVTLPWRTPNGRPVTVALLFVRPDGKPWQRFNFSPIWRAARDAAGAPKTRENGMHVLRHTYASITLHKGVDVLKLAAWLGHEDPGFTLRKYGHFIPDREDLGSKAVDEFLEAVEDYVRAAADDVPAQQ